ncbi:MAG: 23S rRNA (pseudouridine(1915)-N(3))-methyltransferase RlmH [Rickettsiaceae bacterium]|nr:23S rRNA (pseudouridine(1915)-N(3))-methyltransferase RlmH [Rickettsiaceae bacterium]
MFPKILISFIGKTQREFQEAESHYLKLIKTKLILRPYQTLSHLSENEQITKESNILLESVDKDDYLICLDIKGTGFSSEEFAKKISATPPPYKNLHFIIGGSFGLSEEIKSKADLIISISPFTLPHQMAKIILLEQIYRSETIISGKKYHK